MRNAYDEAKAIADISLTLLQQTYSKKNIKKNKQLHKDSSPRKTKAIAHRFYPSFECESCEFLFRFH